MIKAKKRELLDRSLETTTEEIRPKKLKLIIRDRNVTTLLEDFERSTTVATDMALLFEMSTFFPFKAKDSEDVLNKYFQIFRNKDVDVRLKMISLVRIIVQSGWVTLSEMEPFAGLVLQNLLEEEDDECKAHLLSLLADFSQNLICETVLYRKIVQETRKLLFSDLWKLRALALNFVTKLCVKQAQWRKDRISLKSPDILTRQLSKRSDDDKNDVAFDLESTLISFCDDCDERVRVTAVENLINLNDFHWTISVKLYDSFCNILNDPCQTVRLYGLRLVRIMAGLYPETQVPGPNRNVEIRLVDDAFSKLCNAMHDLSVDVRTEAAKLLGTMLNVSEKFLEQTLDKKLMSKLKFWKSTEQKSTSQILSEWSSGRKFGEDAPVEKLDEDSISLIPSGACGAFVTGLEDEYLAVRNASIDAVCHLSQESSSFANKAMDFLADMFNDEIEDVRLNAIISLRRLCQHIVLKEDQMETILNALDDASADSREALRELLSTCTLYSVHCLKLTVESLMNNMKRYPHDKSSIWQCMKHVGRNHPVLVQPMVVDLLGYHPFLDTPEPMIDDAFYISKLVLILNAASGCPPIKSLLKPHTWRHYHYLFNSNNDLVPNLDVVRSIDLAVEISDRLVKNLLDDSERSFKLAFTMKGEAKFQLLKLTLKSFERLCEFHQEFNAKSEFLKLMCQTILLFGRTVSCCWSMKESQSSKILKQVLSNTYKMELLWKFDEFSINYLETILFVRLRVLGELLRTNFKWSSMFISCFDSYSKIRSSTTETLKMFVDDLDSNNYHTVVDKVLSCLDESQTFACDFTDKIQQKTIVFTEPDKNSERVLRFVAGLIASATLSANLKDFYQADFHSLRIRVTFPDQRQQLQMLRMKDIKEINKNIHRLRTDVFISDAVWTDVSNVELELVMKISDSDLLPDDEDGLQYISLTEKIPVRIYPKAKC